MVLVSHEAFCAKDRRQGGIATLSLEAYFASDQRRRMNGAGEFAGAIRDGRYYNVRGEAYRRDRDEDAVGKAVTTMVAAERRHGGGSSRSTLDEAFRRGTERIVGGRSSERLGVSGGRIKIGIARQHRKKIGRNLRDINVDFGRSG